MNVFVTNNPSHSLADTEEMGCAVDCRNKGPVKMYGLDVSRMVNPDMDSLAASVSLTKSANTNGSGHPHPVHVSLLIMVNWHESTFVVYFFK